MSNLLVSVKNMSVEYEGKTALSDISLDVYSGDFVGVTGPNGGGKTTLFKAMLGLVPYSGSINYSNVLMTEGVRRVGYLPQQSAFDRYFPISVVEVVVSGLQAVHGLRKRYRNRDFQTARKLLKTTGILHLENSSIGEISGGQMQRVLLCRALISDPALLLLDEPTTYVDSRFEEDMYVILRELNKRMAIVMISHDVAAVANVAKSIVHIEGSLKRAN